MRIFIFAIIALTAAVFLIFYTQYYVSSSVVELEKSIDLLFEYPSVNEKAPEKHLRCLDDSVDFWQKRRFKICLMVNRNEFEEIENLLLDLRAAAHVGDSGIYSSSLAALKEKLSRLKNSEKLSLDGIL